MAKASINYLFPPDQIDALPTWRFVLHFKAPAWFRERKLKAAIAALKGAEWKIVEFPFSLDTLAYDPKTKCVGVPIEVPEGRRARPGSLEDYESDVWKVCGNMMSNGFGDLFYEAVDWHESGTEG